MKKVILLTNIPAPYREKVYTLVSESAHFEFSVFYCSKIESNRKWKFKLGCYNKVFLKSYKCLIFGRTIYLGSNIIGLLSKEKPDVIIVCGFSLPMLYSYIWAMINGVKFLSFTDGTKDSESNLTFIHKMMRLFFYKRSSACVGASLRSVEMISDYNKDSYKVFQSKLSIDQSNFSINAPASCSREFDIILCGQMISVKMFIFSLDVLFHCKQSSPLKRLRVKIVGDGPDRENILKHATNLGLDFFYNGFVQQEELSKHYSSSKIFLFPSSNEAWGIVANEACACGTPVITTPNTGCSGELIIDNYNGYVLNPDVELWASKIKYLLDNENVLQKFSDNCLHQSALFTQQESADGIIDAIKYAISAK